MKISNETGERLFNFLLDHDKAVKELIEHTAYVEARRVRLELQLSDAREKIDTLENYIETKHSEVCEYISDVNKRISNMTPDR